MSLTFPAEDNRWMDMAACKGADTSLFFPESSKPAAEAMAICARCTVRDQCAAMAKRSRAEYGVWAGQRIGGVGTLGKIRDRRMDQAEQVLVALVDREWVTTIEVCERTGLTRDVALKALRLLLDGSAVEKQYRRKHPTLWRRK